MSFAPNSESRMILARILFLVAAVLPAGLSAHEFWIEPEQYQVESGERLQAKFKNGENFEGSTLSYFDRSSARFDMMADGETTEITPRAGDSPALDIAAPVENGLVVVVHETTPASLTYREWAKFLKFADHKDFTEAEADHIAAGWPRENFRERYTRHAKALFAVGDGAGADRPMGLKTEFVALDNPYVSDLGDTLRVRLLIDGLPRRNAQVEVFDRAPDGAVTVTLHRTNAGGEASIPVTAGHEYLLDAVTLRVVEGADAGDPPLLYETFWAALTFAVPE